MNVTPRDALRRIIGDVNPPPIGRCPAATDNDTTCNGPLRIHTTHTIHVRCSRCGSAWNRDDLVNIVRVVDLWLPIDHVAALIGRDRRTIHRWAADGTIRRNRGTVSYADTLRHLGVSSTT